MMLINKGGIYLSKLRNITYFPYYATDSSGM